MKIAIFAPEPFLGGEVNYIKTLVKALKFCKYNVSLYISSSYISEFKEVCDDSKINIVNYVGIKRFPEKKKWEYHRLYFQL